MHLYKYPDVPKGHYCRYPDVPAGCYSRYPDIPEEIPFRFVKMLPMCVSSVDLLPQGGGRGVGRRFPSRILKQLKAEINASIGIIICKDF
ncbi:hypothetical protein CEXT_24111 [Caerostris extrusa]|uniref:Uncharacterized protein n=1 Tax=Caerostris extrusa TaxID=172846 RepID=A0AAV4SJS9_CAEEX|nr:hypothetical protein CEXT_24111 [Caerostris extrusa]